ncbi:uncharacterized protein LOC114576310 isoform X1 [Exaiptasia diaphana]|uniref:Uncharacterized protein n=1 Tax=Exaiptasia diaphana TaxID=2652724 RepID=A0A913YSP4_EXADI|nr:uncharacterized protein LOC114576310 isoform X1 [Exaiptasia diaphana]
MISEEQRNQKPYAIPVRFFSYHSVTDKRIGELKKEIVEAMKKLQMLPIGFVTDGEFNSLRTAGSERPISIVQLIMDSRNEAKKINSNTIAKYLRPILRQGNIGPEQVHPAVPIADVQWLQDFMTTNNVTFEAAYCPFLHGFVSLYFF